MVVRLRSQVSSQRIAERIIAQAAEEYKTVAKHVADRMQEAYQETVDELYADRPPNRSHGTKLRDSMIAKVTGNDFPIEARLVLAPGADRRKVETLDKGGGAHTRTGVKMSIPTTGGPFKGQFVPGLFSPSTDAYGGDEMLFHRINHPGVRQGGNFLQTALEAGRKAIRA